MKGEGDELDVSSSSNDLMTMHHEFPELPWRPRSKWKDRVTRECATSGASSHSLGYLKGGVGGSIGHFCFIPANMLYVI